jgi:UDP-3-O-[3-hydroxymyristoyl] glucosamine N-acyltransferase
MAAEATTGSIAKMVGGELVGNSESIIERIAPLENAGPKDLTFFEPTAKKKQQDFYRLACESSAGAILVPKHDPQIKATQIVTPNPLATMIRIAAFFHHPPRPAPGIHPTAVVDQSVKLGTGVAVGAYAVIGENCTIGNDTVIYPHVVIYGGAQIGAKCVIHSGAVIREYVTLGSDCLIQNGVVVGGDGFGYIPDPQLGHRRIPHVGTVVLEDSVDLGANTTVDRATLGETRIGRATKVDNLVMIAHNNRIGRGSLLCGQVGVSGSCTIGDNVILGGQVGVADHVTVGSSTRAGAQSGIAGDIAGDVDLFGSPAMPAIEHWRSHAVWKRLPELLRQMREQEKRITELEAKLKESGRPETK